ncbi:MAG: GntR family transcriptional regulator [Candidatus Eremiobacteraeota bacterium]|nr:GntR family transcriptional regulator [Candidatus Eremiobacteraeota bacterium]MBV8643729.1 GntR family transcriptional regulator [Candidatus Eremiobacteraeota bacterium]
MESVTTYDRVLAELRGAILAGLHPPGSRLRQVELAEQYRTSRIPLREALRTLEAEGLVTSEANRGATVAPLDAQDLSELYVFRLALERVTARAAAARRVDLRPRVAAWRAEARAALRQGRIEPLIAADAAFHMAIAEVAGNRHVRAALDGRWAHIARAMRLYLRTSSYRDTVWDEHMEIAEAIAAGNEDLAETLLGAHVQQSENVVLSRLGTT